MFVVDVCGSCGVVGVVVCNVCVVADVCCLLLLGVALRVV